MYLGLHSVMNARDLGGYKTPNGVVKSGILIRTGHLDRVADDDKEKLKQYNITDIVDFRLAEERVGDGTLEWAKEHNINIIDRSNTNESPILQEGYTVEDFKNYLSVAESLGIIGSSRYVNSVKSEYSIKGYRKFFDILLNADGAVLFHCASGKDRTGIAAALLLGALGVSDADITYDFMLSNEYNKKRIDTIREYFMEKTNDKEFTELAVVFFEGVSKEHFDNFLNYINSNFGTIKNYCIQMLGLTIEDIEKLRYKYLDEFRTENMKEM